MSGHTRIVFSAPADIACAVRKLLDDNHLTYGSLFIPLMKDVATNGLRINAKPIINKAASKPTPAKPPLSIDDLTPEEQDDLDFPDDND